MHWFIVASQKEARIFTKTSNRRQLKLLKTLTNPLGSEKRAALIRKQAGRGVKSIGRVGFVSYSEPKRHDPHEQAVKQFAKDISHFLESEKLKNHFDSLTVIAEPRLLGKIRKEMRSDFQELVMDWVKRDLQKTPTKKLTDFLLPPPKKTEPAEFHRNR